MKQPDTLGNIIIETNLSHKGISFVRANEQLNSALSYPPNSPEKLSNNANKLKKRLERLTGKAIADFEMIKDKDVVLVCLSGGKDSYTMLQILLTLQKRAPIDFKIIAMNLNQNHPGFPEHILPNYLNNLGVDYRIIDEDTYSIVQDKIPEKKTKCSLCSRLRRGIIYRVAKELGANKVALGHHKDDIVETLFLNLFFGGKLKAMPPKLITDDTQHIVIRPLSYCSEKDIARYANQMKFPIIPCNLCGSQDNLQRQQAKAMLQQWEKDYPGRTNLIFKSIMNITPSHLADTTQFDFKNLDELLGTENK
ncbi:MAG: tRNA 2-thiocytidine(32) synthetase TtcA [Methylococcales bacterium]|nr:tRNA 2-thiocytidine(32) synthetase TtcA [Methylococcales bacterium]MBT7409531.1 tRNA 2-thiocytidine(32) synthetase TtcA [Methylococcales bacterium]